MLRANHRLKEQHDRATHPVHVAVTVNPVPAVWGDKHAFQSPLSLSFSLSITTVACTVSRTVFLAPPLNVTDTDVPPVPSVPYRHAFAGACGADAVRTHTDQYPSSTPFVKSTKCHAVRQASNKKIN